ncbi:Uncharacterised protein [Vibrio cholerae]|nr:Uncharacterised protein [Vibrio cholerae]
MFEYACVVVVMTGAIRDIETGDRLILTLNFRINIIAGQWQ